MTQGNGSRDAAVARLAGRQRTIVAHTQLIALGCSRRVVSHWVNRGRMQVVFPGVYSVVSGELPTLAREQAALLACGERAFLSHATATAIWGLAPNPPNPPSVIDVTVVGRYRASSDGIRVHRIKAIARPQLKRHEGLWVSSPARAVLEIAATAPAKELAHAIDEGLARRHFTPRALEAMLASNRPCRGAARLAEILGDPTAGAVSRSKREKRLLRLIRDAGLPMPQTNVAFGRFELDFFWPRERLAVELDGYNFHRGPGAFGQDREKDLAARAAGIELLRFTGDHVLKRPWMVLATLSGELALRRAGGQ
jgi:very-short-patch-repair endonuclease